MTNIWNLTPAARDDSSDAIVAELVRRCRKVDAKGTPVGLYIGWDIPVYIVDSTVPDVAVIQRFPKSNWASPSMNKALMKVPIPDNVTVSHTPDHAVCIHQPSTDRYFEFWQLQRNTDGLWVCASMGATNHYSDFSGVFDKNSWFGMSDTTWGVSASGQEIMAGLATADEFAEAIAGEKELPHALTLDMDDARHAQWAAPATRCDGLDTSPNSVPEGAWFKLREDFDVTTIQDPAARAIARTFLVHGARVRDKTWQRVMLSLAHPLEGQRRWAEIFPNIGKTIKEVPIEHLELMPMSLHS